MPDLLTTLLATPEPERALAGLCRDLIGEVSLSPEEQLLVDGAPSASPELVADVRRSIAEGADVIGDAFCAIRGGVARRERGQFYTPAPIVESMVAWALEGQPARVVDAGCGSGRYAVAMRRRGFVGELLAVDLDPLATLMTRAHLSAAGFSDVRVECASFIGLELAAIEGPTCFIGNPPYLRHNHLPREVKAWAKRAGSLLDVPVSGLAGLHALFFLAVAELASDGDFGTFITSSEWLDARYGALVRSLLGGKLGLERLDVLDPAALAFDDANTTACIAAFRAGFSGPASVRHATTPSEMSRLEGGVEVPRSRLSRSSWSSLGAADTPVAPGLVPLGTHVRVSRGLATGANKFFTRPAADAASEGLEPWAVPLVAKAQDLFQATNPGNLTSDDVSRVLLVLPHRSSSALVERLVQAGEEAGLQTGYINQSRADWYRLTPGDRPAALATYMARQPPLFALNTAGAANLNTVHGLHLRPSFPADLLPALVGWLNEHREDLAGGRTYAGGLRKIEPREMEGFLVPTVDALRAWAAQR